MAYERQLWQDAPSHDSPITAARLNHMEEGIETGGGSLPTKSTALNGGDTANIGTSPSSPGGLAANVNRIEVGIYNDDDTGTIYLGLGTTAVVGRGPRIEPGGPPWINNSFAGAISVISTAANTPISYYAV